MRKLPRTPTERLRAKPIKADRAEQPDPGAECRTAGAAARASTPLAPSYCVQNHGDCATCALKNSRRACQNNPIVREP